MYQGGDHVVAEDLHLADGPVAKVHLLGRVLLLVVLVLLVLLGGDFEYVSRLLLRTMRLRPYSDKMELGVVPRSSLNENPG